MVFEDASGRRRTVARTAFGIAALVATAALALSQVSHRRARERTRLVVARVSSVEVALHTPSSAPSQDHEGNAAHAPLSADYLELLARLDARSAALVSALEGPPLPLPQASTLVFAINAPNSDASIAAHRDAIRVVSPDWLRVRTSGCAVERLAGTSPRGRLPPDALILPRVANLEGDRWTSAETAALLADDTTRACTARAVAAQIVALGADGVNVDFEALAPEDAAGLVSFVAELRAALHPHGKRVTVDVSVGDHAYDLARLGAVADAVVLMAYDEHHVDGAPGPIASRAFVESRVREAAALVPHERLVVAIGSYCRDWSAVDARGDRIVRSFGVAETLAHAAAIGATPVFATGTANARFDYRDATGRAHEVWCVDAVAAAESLAIAASYGITRTALWRAGSEDSSIWPLLAARDRGERLAALASVAPPPLPIVEGSGDIVTVIANARAGSRSVHLDAAGHVQSAQYLIVPAPMQLARLGDDSGEGVVLTFDDGPDARWTPAVLDVLRALDAPATFFAVGSAAQSHPTLVARARREGHLVASHSFHHPHMDTLDESDVRAELDHTAHVLEGLVDHEILLYRAPYSAFLTSPEDLAAQHIAFEAGYTYVTASVDPQDWSEHDAGTISARILAEVAAGGRVVVLHDGGGDRAATVEALRRVIPELRALGHPIVSLAAYAGVDARELTPPLRPSERTAALVGAATDGARSFGSTALSVLFAFCTALAALRVISLASLVLRDALRARRVLPTPGFAPLVTVLVPAYNESKVIVESVRALLTAEYAHLEILVVDDGSTDDTADLVDAIATHEPRVRCLRKSNGGKASAANLGMRHARGEIVVAVDADTVIAPDAIRRMVAHFADRRVTAVCGNVEVGNVRSLLTAFQAIEYVTSQNFDRRAFQSLNCIGVVPGALGAWRRDAVLEVGGYGDDTLVEDADLTLCVLRAGGVIAYEPRAIGRTEAPETLGALWKQRFRWTYGTYQCLAKHRGSFFRGALGWVAMPNALVFQVLFPLISPIGDLALVAAIISGQSSAILSGYLGFLAMDLIASAMAFSLDKKPLHWLPLLLIQRFTYRQFLYLVSLRAMVAVLAGRAHGWSKLERTGTVTAPVATITPVPPPMPLGQRGVFPPVG